MPAHCDSRAIIHTNRNVMECGRWGTRWGTHTHRAGGDAIGPRRVSASRADGSTKLQQGAQESTWNHEGAVHSPQKARGARHGPRQESNALAAERAHLGPTVSGHL